jgi:hypothetical protein
MVGLIYGIMTVAVTEQPQRWIKERTGESIRREGGGLVIWRYRYMIYLWVSTYEYYIICVYT